MKNSALFITSLVLVVTGSMLLPGCFKDTCTRTYTIMRPVYKTKAAVRAAIGSDAPQPVVTPGKLFILGNYIFLNEINRGIHIIDNTHPASPKNVAFINIPGNVDLAVKANTLYADLYTDLVTLDITNPLKVMVKKISGNAFPFRYYGNGFTADSSRIIVDWLKKDTTVTVDCSGNNSWGGCPSCFITMDAQRSTTNAATATSLVGIGGSMARFSIISNNLYTVSDADLNVFSIADAENPVFIKKVNIGPAIETIYPFQDKLFIGSASGMFIYDVANPDNPVKKGQFNHARACDPVIADNRYAFVTLRNGNTRCPNVNNELDVLDVSNLSSPVLLKSYAMTNPHGLSKDGNTLFICDGKDGLKVYDAANVRDLKLIRQIKGFESYDVIAANKLAIVVTKDRMLQFDYSDLNNIKLLGSIVWDN